MALNRTLKGFLEDFKRNFSLDDDMNESISFEYFVNYLIVSRYCPDEVTESVDLDVICVDKNGLFGIDAIAFIVNGNLVLSPDDINDFSKSKRLDVQVLFIQSKTESKVDTGDFLKAIQAARLFIEDGKVINDNNANIQNAIDIYNRLFESSNSRYLTDLSPRVNIFFVTSANEIESDIVQPIIEAQQRDIIKACSDIKDAKISVLGARDISMYYREVTNSFNVEIHFEHAIELNQIEGVSKAYIGYLPSREYLKIITDDRGDIRKKIFYENVRDYQGEKNSVNSEIRKTLLMKPDSFILLNNGVTLITKALKSLGGNNYSLADIQVVNGCQTSYELYYCKEKICSDLNIPLKIIYTTDQDVIYSIIRSTNRQTQVPDEAFITLSEYHKELEELFSRLSEEMPLKIFYERRPGEYDSDTSLYNYQKINLHELIRDVTSIYFNDAYVVANNNPVNIYEGRKERLFLESHPKEIYFIAAYLNALHKKIRNRQEHLFNYMKYYITMVSRVLLLEGASNMQLSDTKNMLKECNFLIDKMKTTNMGKIFDESFDVIKKAYNKFCDSKSWEEKEDRARRNAPRSKDFCEFVIKETKLKSGS